MNWFEKHLGKYCINNLSLIMIIFYGFGFVLQSVNAQFLQYLTLNPYAILHGQVWRLVTWLLVPQEQSNFFFILIAMLFYYSIGTSLERTWGTVKYNEYLFQGIIFTILGAFIVFGVSMALYGGAMMPEHYQLISNYFTTYYVLMSIFLAYAATFPNAMVLLMFFIPVKVKWLGIAYGALMVYEFITYAVQGGWFICVAMAASLLNFFFFFYHTKDFRRYSPSEIKRRNAYKKAMDGMIQKRRAEGRSHVKMQASASVHQCAICGRTDQTNPELEFRYCSKCAGVYEFCSDHLFVHEHARNGGKPMLRVQPAEATDTKTQE